MTVDMQMQYIVFQLIDVDMHVLEEWYYCTEAV